MLTKVATITGTVANALLISAIIPGSSMILEYLSMKIPTTLRVHSLIGMSREAKVGEPRSVHGDL